MVIGFTDFLYEVCDTLVFFLKKAASFPLAGLHATCMFTKCDGVQEQDQFTNLKPEKQSIRS